MSFVSNIGFMISDFIATHLIAHIKQYAYMNYHFNNKAYLSCF